MSTRCRPRTFSSLSHSLRQLLGSKATSSVADVKSAVGGSHSHRQTDPIPRIDLLDVVIREVHLAKRPVGREHKMKDLIVDMRQNHCVTEQRITTLHLDQDVILWLQGHACLLESKAGSREPSVGAS
jgi:hypothetical protein